MRRVQEILVILVVWQHETQKHRQAGRMWILEQQRKNIQNNSNCDSCWWGWCVSLFLLLLIPLFVSPTMETTCSTVELYPQPAFQPSHKKALGFCASNRLLLLLLLVLPRTRTPWVFIRVHIKDSAWWFRSFLWLRTTHRYCRNFVIPSVEVRRWWVSPEMKY